MSYDPKMQHLLRDNLLLVVEQLSLHRGLPKTSIVRAIWGHPAAWTRVKQGRSPITTALYDRFMGGISALWPDDVPWPDGVLRPPPEPEALKCPEYLEQKTAA